MEIFTPKVFLVDCKTLGKTDCYISQLKYVFRLVENVPRVVGQNLLSRTWSGRWSVFQFLFFDPRGILYGVENGKFLKRAPPKFASDNWLRSATLIGTGGWNRFQFLFFMADGDLYGVHSGKFYKRSVPTHGGDNWLRSAKMIGTGGWSVFKYLMSPLDQPGTN